MQVWSIHWLYFEGRSERTAIEDELKGDNEEGDANKKKQNGWKKMK